MFFQSQIGTALFSLLEPSFQRALEEVQTPDIQEVLLKTIKPSIHNLRNEAKNKKLLQDKIHQQIAGPMIWALLVDPQVSSAPALCDAMLQSIPKGILFSPFKIITLEAPLPVHLIAGALFSLGKDLKKAQESSAVLTPRKQKILMNQCTQTCVRTIRALEYLESNDSAAFKQTSWLSEILPRIALFGPRHAQHPQNPLFFSLYSSHIQQIFVEYARKQGSYDPQYFEASIALGLAKYGIIEDFSMRMYLGGSNTPLPPSFGQIAQDIFQLFLPYHSLPFSSSHLAPEETLFLLLKKRHGPVAALAPHLLSLLEQQQFLDTQDLTSCIQTYRNEIVNELFYQGKSAHHGTCEWLTYLFAHGLNPLWIGENGQTLLSSLNDCAKHYLQSKNISAALYSAQKLSAAEDSFVSLCQKATRILLEAGCPSHFILPQIPLLEQFALPQMQQVARQIEEQRQLQQLLPEKPPAKQRKVL